MDLRQLEYLVAVAEERNFTRAAERVHVSQSGISAQIRQLERELGATLFDRSTRSVTLTGAGKAALDHARACLAAATAIGQVVSEVTGLLRGRLTLGTVVGCTLTPLFDALAAFHRAHPGVEIALWEEGSDRLLEGVRTGALDLALVGSAGVPPRDLETLTVIREPLVAAVPAGHPLTTSHRLTLAELAGLPLACMPRGTGLRAAFDEDCAAVGLEPTITLEAGAADALAELAVRGLAVAILSESMAAGHPDRLIPLPVEDLATRALLALAWKPTPNPAVRAVVEQVRSAFAAPAAVSGHERRKETSR
jgi:DNA-binding transcriptional LysR family regulator